MVTALILAGGIGLRFGGDIPKQYDAVCGRALIEYCLETVFSCDKIDKVRIVAAKNWRGKVEKMVSRWDYHNRFAGFSEPGFNRQMSILNGLKDMKGDCGIKDYVLIHDAARPFVQQEDLHSLIRAAQGHDGAIPVLPMKDTVYISRDGISVSELIDRSVIYAGQSPEIFVYGKYLSANENLPDIMRINGSTEPAVMAGMDIVMIPGNERNFKVTTQNDMNIFRSILEKREIDRGDIR